MPSKITVWQPTTTSRGNIQKVGISKGEQNRRGAFDAGSCAHDDLDTPEIFCISGSRLY